MLVASVLGTLATVAAALSAGESVTAFADDAAGLLAVLAAAVCHELGHVAVALGTGSTLGGLRLDLFGARLSLGGVMSYRRELAIASGGPFVNLLLAAIAFPLWMARGAPQDSPICLFFVACMGLAAINLLPVGTLDGGRMLRCTLAMLLGDRAATVVLRLTTALCLGALWLFSVYALLRIGEMLSLFAFSLCLLGRMMGQDADA